MKPLHFRLAALTLWSALIAITVFTAPPGAPDTGDLISRMVTGKLEGVNLSLFALFNLMGVWPAVMAVALRGDAPGWKWPFIALSFGIGAFALLPYFIFRPWLVRPAEDTSFIARLLSSHWVRRALMLAVLCFGTLFFFGGLTEFARLFQTQQFPYVMSFDFFAFCGAATLLATERQLIKSPRAGPKEHTGPPESSRGSTSASRAK